MQPVPTQIIDHVEPGGDVVFVIRPHRHEQSQNEAEELEAGTRGMFLHIKILGQEMPAGYCWVFPQALSESLKLRNSGCKACRTVAWTVLKELESFSLICSPA